MTSIAMFSDRTESDVAFSIEVSQWRGPQRIKAQGSRILFIIYIPLCSCEVFRLGSVAGRCMPSALTLRLFRDTTQRIWLPRFIDTDSMTFLTKLLRLCAWKWYSRGRRRTLNDVSYDKPILTLFSFPARCRNISESYVASCFFVIHAFNLDKTSRFEGVRFGVLSGFGAVDGWPRHL